MIDKIIRRLKLIFAIGKSTKTSQTTLEVNYTQGEANPHIEFTQGYGLEVHPLPGAKAVTIFNAGDRSQGVAVIVADRRYTLELEPGDVALHDFRGQHIKLHSGGIDMHSIKNININAEQDININANGAMRLTASKIYEN